MPAFDFPTAPAINDVFEKYKWNGVAWKKNTTTVRPTLTAIIPQIAGVNDADLVVRVLGADFTLDSQIFLDAAVQTTTYVSATELTFPYAINGTEYATVTVVTGGLVSLPGQLFQVIYHPIVTTLVPNGAAAGSAAFTLTVQGGQFMGPGSVGETAIYIDGVAVATTYIGQTQVTCQVTPPAAAATQQVTVRNGPVTTSPVTNLPLTFT